jgi:hypothetical protein
VLKKLGSFEWFESHSICRCVLWPRSNLPLLEIYGSNTLGETLNEVQVKMMVQDTKRTKAGRHRNKFQKIHSAHETILLK